MQVEFLGLCDYQQTWQAMQAWAAAPDAPERLWLCEHPPVFTLGLAGKAEHVLDPGPIPVLHTDRGGQVTYHGPGQVIAYPLIDLSRRNIYVKEYVFRLEQAALATLEVFGVTGHRVGGAPGLYINLQDPFGHAILSQRPQQRTDPLVAPTPDFTGLGKIAALGIKVKRQRAYHGLALNVAMNLAPFARINPCGYARLQTVDLSSLGIAATWQDAAHVLAQEMLAKLEI